MKVFPERHLAWRAIADEDVEANARRVGVAGLRASSAEALGALCILPVVDRPGSIRGVTPPGAETCPGARLFQRRAGCSPPL